MTAKEILAEAERLGFTQSVGKANAPTTLYAVMARDEAAFEKVGRGLWKLRRSNN